MSVDNLNDEEGRLGALHRLGLSAMMPAEPLDRIVETLRTALGVSGAMISIIDRARNLVLAASGDCVSDTERGQSIAGMALGQTDPLIIENGTADPRLAMLGSGNGPGAYLGVPLVSGDGYVLGCLEAVSAKPRSFSSDEVAVAVNLAHLAMEILNARQPESCDALTGLLTRRRFQAEVEREFDRASRYERPAALIFLDVDGFGRINSALGLRTADQVLKSIANRISETLRASDSVGRIGGEEFGLLLPETLAYEASQCAERLREEIGRLRFRNPTGVLSVTASFGIAPLNPDIKSAVDWFAKADIALYGAKQSGRNCVTFASPGDEAETANRHDEVTAPLLSRLH